MSNKKDMSKDKQRILRISLQLNNYSCEYNIFYCYQNVKPCRTRLANSATICKYDTIMQINTIANPFGILSGRYPCTCRMNIYPIKHCLNKACADKYSTSFISYASNVSNPKELNFYLKYSTPDSNIFISCSP